MEEPRERKQPEPRQAKQTGRKTPDLVQDLEVCDEPAADVKGGGGTTPTEAISFNFTHVEF